MGGSGRMEGRDRGRSKDREMETDGQKGIHRRGKKDRQIIYFVE